MSNYYNKPDMVVYTDGSCHGNGQRNATGGYGTYWGPNDSRNTSAPLTGSRQTNQRAELTAIREAVSQANESARHYGGGRPTVVVKTDSQYGIDSLTKYHHTWNRNGWQTQSGAPVANQDLIRGTLNDIRGGDCDVRFEHVRGHGNSAGNNAAHNLANAGARSNNGGGGRRGGGRRY
ncbi:hypothetical protein IWW38_002991 [Coemansia aciculifera]|uniref:Uncharacterized protein n=1 Tax=Coemansia aciculifera TaxID=417176 RepID=A0ACC1M1Z4_9FUNG|nr:hypothetical protein IWW38_002991 [Coemansia aciculifera]